MFKRNGKVVSGLILLFVIAYMVGVYVPVAAQEAVSHNKSGNMLLVSQTVPSPGNKLISDFLATVDFAGQVLEFDHNRDGMADMLVYPLKTSKPDLKTDYYTVSQAVSRGDIVVREDPRNYVPGMQRFIPPDQNIRGPNVVAQYFGGGYGMGGGIGFFQRGQGFIGGGQNRGFGNSGILGNRRYGSGNVGGGGFRYDQVGYNGKMGNAHSQFAQQTPNASAVNQPQEILDVFCFEKNRVIHMAMNAGSSDLFVNTPMVSPSVRKGLVTSTSQVEVDQIVAAELKRRNIFSPTLALHDIFNNPGYQQSLQWYQRQWSKVVKGNQGVTGMICADGHGNILCVDIYASPKLFKKMLPELFLSSAIEASTFPGRKSSPNADVSGFLAELKKMRNWTEGNGGAFIITSPALVSEAVLFDDGQGGQFVHLEAYSN